ncbi:D-2-hydroxyacid dehydrogenase [Alloiococcus sp. CFN-8]|uniref:D-2-hydroxyacid dehydrogenase n=1 Tax=Alloiococcus sp. CFN-8 TaxID=3416081 RepID=UPI003CF1F885
MNKILVILPVDESHKKSLEVSSLDSEFIYCSKEKLTREIVHSADIIIGNAPISMVKGSERLKWIQLNSSGTDGYTDYGVLNNRAILTNARGAYGVALSEYMIAALLMIMKKLNLYYNNQKSHKWSDEGTVSSIYGAKILLLGLGDIGTEFAKRINALGGRIIAIRRNTSIKPDFVEEVHDINSLKELLPKVDVVVSCVPKNKDTHRIFDKEAFSIMKKGAYFVNAGRGSAVDSYALYEALNSGHIAGAAIDVTDPEPLPPDHILWEAKNLLITPHIAGEFHLQLTLERIIKISSQNLHAYFHNEELNNVVDFR